MLIYLSKPGKRSETFSNISCSSIEGVISERQTQEGEGNWNIFIVSFFFPLSLSPMNQKETEGWEGRRTFKRRKGAP